MYGPAQREVSRKYREANKEKLNAQKVIRARERRAEQRANGTYKTPTVANREAARRYRENHPEHVKLRHLKYWYGINSIQEYEDLLKGQDYN